MATHALLDQLVTRTMLVGSALVITVLVVLGCTSGERSTEAPAGQTVAYPPWQSPRLFTFPGNWALVPAVTVRTIYPAQASWQFVTGPEHLGSASVKAGTPCASCHGNPVVGASSVAGWAGPPTDHRKSAGCQACHGVLHQRVERLGEQLASRAPVQLDPSAAKRPSIDIEVKAVYDHDYLYMRFAWATQRPGITHDLLRWDGRQWKVWSGSQSDSSAQAMGPGAEDRLAVIIDDRNLPAYEGTRETFAQAGCWITCHDGGKYLLSTRTQTGTGEEPTLQSDEAITRLFATGEFLDLLTWRAARSGPIGYADDAYVLASWLRDQGEASFITQTHPAYMYNAAKVGFHAIPEATFEARRGAFPLIQNDTAVPFNPMTSFTPGDLLSRRVLRRPTGSAADVLANSRWENGRWQVELRRKLHTGHPDDKVFEPGKMYTIGLAIFDNLVSNQQHHVSFPVTLGLGVSGDITAHPIVAAHQPKGITDGSIRNGH